MANESTQIQDAPSNEKRTSRRDTIIAAAAELFVENGIKKTSIAKVMDQAGLTRELFYYYFEDKSDLISNVIGLYVKDSMRVIEDWINQAPQFIDPGTPIEQQLVAIIGLVRGLVEGEGGFRGDRLPVVMESGLMVECATRVFGHFVDCIRKTESYEYSVRLYGEAAPYNTEMLLYGFTCMMIVHPELTDEEIAHAACMRIPESPRFDHSGK